VTLATALIEAPDWLLQAYREGRCRGINELYDQRRLHGEHGDAVEAWAAQQPSITRDRLTELRAALERPPGAAPSTVIHALQPSAHDDATDKETAAAPAIQTRARSPAPAGDSPDLTDNPTRSALPEATTRADQRVHVEFEGHDYQLVVSLVPDHVGCMYVRPLTGGPRRLAPVAALKLLGFVGG